MEWGQGIYGIEQAAKSYFNKAPNELLPEEAAWLATILRNLISAWKQQYLKKSPQMWRVRLALDWMKNLTASERRAARVRHVQFSYPKHAQVSVAN